MMPEQPFAANPAATCAAPWGCRSPPADHHTGYSVRPRSAPKGLTEGAVRRPMRRPGLQPNRVTVAIPPLAGSRRIGQISVTRKRDCRVDEFCLIFDIPRPSQNSWRRPASRAPGPIRITSKASQRMSLSSQRTVAAPAYPRWQTPQAPANIRIRTGIAAARDIRDLVAASAKQQRIDGDHQEQQRRGDRPVEQAHGTGSSHVGCVAGARLPPR